MYKKKSCSGTLPSEKTLAGFYKTAFAHVLIVSPWPSLPGWASQSVICREVGPALSWWPCHRKRMTQLGGSLLLGAFHSILLPEFLEFSVEWFEFRKLNSQCEISGNFSWNWFLYHLPLIPTFRKFCLNGKRPLYIFLEMFINLTCKSQMPQLRCKW